MWNFWLFTGLPLTKMKKKINLNREILFKKAWKYVLIGVGYADHNAPYQNFVWQVLLSYEGFSWIVIGRIRHRVLKHGVWVEWNGRRTATQVPFHFDGLTHFMPTCLQTFWFFQEPFIVETWNLCHWIQHTSNPKYAPLKPFWCIFANKNQQNVKFLPVYWTPPDKKKRKKKDINLIREKCLKRLENWPI